MPIACRAIGGEVPPKPRRAKRRRADVIFRNQQIVIELKCLDDDLLVSDRTLKAATRPTKSAAEGLIAALQGAATAMSGFRSSTAALPRMTKELNIAKRLQVAALDSLISEFGKSEQLLVASVAVLDVLLQEQR